MASSSQPGADAKHSMSHGEVKKADTAVGKLTIKHGPLENLEMNAMTIVFKVKDPAMLSQVKVGDKIDFVAEQVDGALTVTGPSGGNVRGSRPPVPAHAPPQKEADLRG